MKTPQKPYPKFSETLGTPELWFKREDLHPYGSHKGRSIPQMIKEYAKMGIKKFAISSSGNAALAAIIAVQKHSQNNPGSSLDLTVYVGEHIEEAKLKILYKEIQGSEQIHIQKVPNPKQMAFQMEKDNTIEGVVSIKNLRQSTDDLALRGYAELAEDLSKIPNLQAVFIPTSSGTTAQALGEAILKMNLPIQIHIVQTSACHPIAETFDTSNTEQEKESLAAAIVDHVAHRKEKVIEAIKNTQGSGWIVSNTEIKNAMDLIKNNTDFTASPNSALSLAGLIKAQENGWTWTAAVCCLITGR
jgi:threonine synthase